MSSIINRLSEIKEKIKEQEKSEAVYRADLARLVAQAKEQFGVASSGELRGIIESLEAEVQDHKKRMEGQQARIETMMKEYGW